LIEKKDKGQYVNGNITAGSPSGYAQILDALIVKAAGKEDMYNMETTRPVRDAVIEMVKVMSLKVGVR